MTNIDKQIEAKNKPLNLPEKKIFQLYAQGADDEIVTLELNKIEKWGHVTLKDIEYWKAYGDNADKIRLMKKEPIWKALKIVNDPQDNSEAWKLLEHHPESKRLWSKQVDVTSGGEKLPTPIINVSINDSDEEG